MKAHLDGALFLLNKKTVEKFKPTNRILQTVSDAAFSVLIPAAALRMGGKAVVKHQGYFDKFRNRNIPI